MSSEVRRIVKRHSLLIVAKDKTLWKGMIAHALKGNDKYKTQWSVSTVGDNNMRNM